jgi:hypothetical protein
MSGRSQQLIPLALLEGLRKEGASSEAIDEFGSALIIAYEQALDSGLTPSAALAAMLDWVLSEFQKSTSS